jgi:hypothetical protein
VLDKLGDDLAHVLLAQGDDAPQALVPARPHLTAARQPCFPSALSNCPQDVLTKDSHAISIPSRLTVDYQSWVERGFALPRGARGDEGLPGRASGRQGLQRDAQIRVAQRGAFVHMHGARGDGSVSESTHPLERGAGT